MWPNHKHKTKEVFTFKDKNADQQLIVNSLKNKKSE